MDDSTRDLLRRLELSLLEPAVRNAPEAVAALLADDFIEFGSSGRVFDKPQIIQAIRGEDGVSRSVTDFRVVELAPGLALVTYRVSRNDDRSSLRSSIWQHTESGWRMRFHQGTPVATDGG